MADIEHEHIDHSRPVLSIVTGTLSRPMELRRLVRSIVNNTSVPWELIIQDATPGFTKAQQQDLYWEFNGPLKGRADANVRYFHEDPRLGHVKGYNAGFRRAIGHYVMWLNDDAEVLTGYDISGIQTLRNNPAVGLGAFYYLESGKWHVNVLYRMIFANFGILRRDFGNQIGWFDEDFEMYGGDNSLTFRTLMAGKGVVTVPGRCIIHHSEPDAVRVDNQRFRVGAPQIIDRNYGPHKAAMQAVYAKTAHLVGPRILPILEHA